MARGAGAPQTDLLGHLEVASAKPNADDTTIGRTTRFVERPQIYRIQDSTLFGLIETNETTTLRFDPYHCDDDERCRDDMEYLLDVSVPRERLMIIEGAGERLHGSFSAAILTADLYGDALRLLTA